MHPQLTNLDGHTSSGTDVQFGAVDIGLRSWDEAVRVLLAVHLHGTVEGRKMAEGHLVRMAQIADLAQNAVGLLDRLPEVAMAPLGEHWTQLRDTLLTHAKALSPNAELSAAEMSTDDSAPDALKSDGPQELVGMLAAHSGKQLTLEVCYSAAGFYLGTYLDGEPYTRESREYWPRREQALQALANGQWTQKQNL